MIVCHCFAVNDGRVREAVADGARTVDDIVARCGAGGRCGGCRPLVADLLADAGVIEDAGEAKLDLRSREPSAA